MSRVIAWEVQLLWISVAAGVFLMIIYDVLRIFRNLVRHGTLWLSIEDLVYWLFCSLVVFLILYQQNDGTLRGFAIVCVFLGMVIYNYLVSRYLVRFITKVLETILKWVWKPFAFVGRPVKALSAKVKKRSANILKKCVKSFKIGLKKH